MTTATNGVFDATLYDPSQTPPRHPVGKFQFIVRAADIVPTKDNSGGVYVVTFETPVGSVVNRFNLWNQSVQAVEIAHKQLAALSYVTGRFKLNMATKGQEIIGGQGMLEVQEQPPPNNQYTQIVAFMFPDGSLPKAGQPGGGAPPPQPAAPQPPQPPAAPPAGAWGAPPPPPAAGAPAWGTPAAPGPVVTSGPQPPPGPAWGAPQQPGQWQPGNAAPPAAGAPAAPWAR